MQIDDVSVRPFVYDILYAHLSTRFVQARRARFATLWPRGGLVEDWRPVWIARVNRRNIRCM